MKRRLLWLAVASLVCADSKSFSINDDLLAFPQYEMVFSDQYVGDAEAESRLAFSFSNSAATSIRLSPSSQAAAPTLDLSTREKVPGDGAFAEADGKTEETSALGYERMVLDSRPYLCSIPQVKKPAKNSTEPEVDRRDDEKELARASDRGLELLQDMEGHCMYYMSGWWSYSFCYQSEVKQFHPLPPGKGGVPAFPPVEDEQVPAYILGHFEPKKPSMKQVEGGSPAGAGEISESDFSQEQQQQQQQQQQKTLSRAVSIQTKGEMRYMVQNLTGGTICDLTGKPRKVEVQFHCHPQSNDRIGWIKEIATCSYLMVIYTPRLCNDVAFLPPKENKAAQIVCREIVPEAEVEAWQQRKAAEAERKLLAANSQSSSRPVVGGIVVGGMKQVGGEGKRITAPQAVEEHATQKGEVIARWDPEEDGGRVRQLSDSDLRDLDLDPRTVDKMREQIHENARGRPWSMEVVEIANGMRQLVGIVDEDDEDGYYDDEGVDDENVAPLPTGDSGGEEPYVPEGEDEGGKVTAAAITTTERAEEQRNERERTKAKATADEQQQQQQEEEVVDVQGSQEIFKDEL